MYVSMYIYPYMYTHIHNFLNIDVAIWIIRVCLIIHLSFGRVK